MKRKIKGRDDMKKCCKCKKNKNISEFDFRNDSNKYREDCKKCRKKRINSHYKKNKKEINEKHKKYNKKHKKDKKEYDKARYLKNKDKRKEYNRRRRAKKEKVGEYFSIEDERFIRNLFNNECFCCKSKNNLAIDHIYPLSKGNPLTLKNACVLCKSCNSSKAAKNPLKFFGKAKFKKLLSIIKIGLGRA